MRLTFLGELVRSQGERSDRRLLRRKVFFCADPVSPSRCITESSAETLLELLFFSSSDIFIALRYAMATFAPLLSDTILSQNICDNIQKQVSCGISRDPGVGEIGVVTCGVFSPACNVLGPPQDPDRCLQSVPGRCTLPAQASCWRIWYRIWRVLLFVPTASVDCQPLEKLRHIRIPCYCLVCIS